MLLAGFCRQRWSRLVDDLSTKLGVRAAVGVFIVATSLATAVFFVGSRRARTILAPDAGKPDKSDNLCAGCGQAIFRDLRKHMKRCCPELLPQKGERTIRAPDAGKPGKPDNLCAGCGQGNFPDLRKHMKRCCPELLPQMGEEHRAGRKEFSENDWISEEEVKEAAMASFAAVKDPLLRHVLELRFGADRGGGRRTPLEVADMLGGKNKGNAQAAQTLIRNALRSIPLVADDPSGLEVLYEDSELLAVSKPPFLRATPVHRFTGKSLTNQLVGYLERAAAQGGPAEERPAVNAPQMLHRLDQQTSGVVLCAKSTKAASNMQAQWHGPDCSKRYLALAKRSSSCVIPGNTLLVDAPIGKDPLSDDPVRRAVNQEGQSAKTRFEVLASRGSILLLACTLEESGRTHQIRVHASHSGFPLLGDEMYGGPAATSEAAGINRVALHAWRLKARHPSTDAPLEIEAPIPADMQQCLQGHGLSWNDLHKAL